MMRSPAGVSQASAETLPVSRFGPKCAEAPEGMDVLVVDIGGTHIKMLASGQSEVRRFESTADLTAERVVERVRDLTRDWSYDVVSIGYPGEVDADGPIAEPGNLGPGWIGFDFARAFKKPVRVVNDAVMQALGGYDGGRMLFLGLGTGLGSALVTEHVVVPLELGSLPYCADTMADYLGRDGLASRGKAAWQSAVETITEALRKAFSADYVVLGGGNATIVDPLPPASRRGGNDDAFRGGFRLWEEMVEPHDREPSRAWRVVR
jgi:polyphosphate glucokinase